MTIEAVDYSYSRPSPAALYAAGIRAVGRYLTDPGSGNKGISQSEWDALTAAGLSVFFVWENGATAALLGHVQGVADAHHAQTNLNNLKGPSNSRPIYFAVDTDTTAAAVRPYFEGVNSVIGVRRTGVYGSYNVCSDLYTAGLVSKKWQTSAWSNGRRLNTVDVYQYDVDTASNPVILAGAHVDRNRIYSSSYGQKSVLLAKAPKPVPRNQPIVVFIRDTATRGIYSVGPEASTLHHVTPAEWKAWKALGYRYTDVPATSLTGFKRE